MPRALGRRTAPFQWTLTQELVRGLAQSRHHPLSGLGSCEKRITTRSAQKVNVKTRDGFTGGKRGAGTSAATPTSEFRHNCPLGATFSAAVSLVSLGGCVYRFDEFSGASSRDVAVNGGAFDQYFSV
ncbi:hypothetical protein E4U40_003181 [Claviceps sp. LM458 group G5]|nr:hypothetical protein E4U40_003181 [Claviceps sp. LM458 group G5]